MAISRRKRPKAMPPADGSSAQVLPDDLVLEIVARCRTVADVIRCAATSKPIRRGILNAPFLRRLVREDGHGDFIPSLLLGLYHKTDDPHRPPAFVPAPGDRAENKYPQSVAALPPAPPDRDASRYGSYLPVASRRSLLVLGRQCRVSEMEHLRDRHGVHPVELSACNPTTGERWVLPPHDLMDTSHAVLDVAQPLAPSAFRLLVAELTESKPDTLYVQIFSSVDGDWGDVLYCSIPRGGCEFVPGPGGRPAGPVVVGDTVNWLCNTDVGHHVLSWRWRGNGGGVQHKASLLKLPHPFENCSVDKCLAVLPSAGSRLSLVVLGYGEIEVWVRFKSGRRFKWEPLSCFQGTDVARPVGFGEEWLSGKDLSCYCEGSGTLLLQSCTRDRGPSLLVGLEYNREVTKLKATIWDMPPAAEFCPYEIDLLSYMLFLMKTF